MTISPFPHNWAETVLSGPPDQHVCLVVVTDVKGSAPREAGSMMLVFADHIMGSIGGGALEYKAIETARAHRLEAGFERQTRSYPLGPSLGQCCGGQVRLMYEWYNPATLPAQPALAELAAQKDGYSMHDTASQNVPAACQQPHDDIAGNMCLLTLSEQVCDVFIYGAGHVGRSVVELARHLHCRIYWIDVDDGRYPETIPPTVIKLPAQAPQTIAARAPDDAIHLVMTYSHQLDYDIVSVLLASGEFAQCGLIGSETKATRFRNRLEKNGISSDQINRLVCPVGLQQVAGKAPLQVALSITAQLSNWLEDRI